MLGHFTYLVFELVWAVPVLTVQWIVGWRDLRAAGRTWIAGVLLPTVYLSLADGVAIRNGIWVFQRSRILGLGFAGVPVEEVLFFLVTNALVAQAVILVFARLRRMSAGSPRGSSSATSPSCLSEPVAGSRHARE